MSVDIFRMPLSLHIKENLQQPLINNRLLGVVTRQQICHHLDHHPQLFLLVIKTSVHRPILPARNDVNDTKFDHYTDGKSFDVCLLYLRCRLPKNKNMFSTYPFPPRAIIILNIILIKKNLLLAHKFIILNLNFPQSLAFSVYQTTVYGHKYSSPSIFFTIYISYKTIFFPKKNSKLSLGRVL